MCSSRLYELLKPSMVDLLHSLHIVQSHRTTPLSGAGSQLQALPYTTQFRPINKENRPLITYEPVECEK